MDRIKLASHVKKGDTLYTPYTEPDGLGKTLKITSWSKSWLPEFMWIGLIISELGRKQGLEQLYKIIDELQENKICVPYFSKIKGLDREKRKLYWNIVCSYISQQVLSPLTVVVTPDIDDIFYNKFFDFSFDIDDCILNMFNVIKQCDNFHDELTTDICFVVDWFYVRGGILKISSNISILPEALTGYYKHNHDEEIMRTYRPIIRSTFQGMCGTYNNDFSKMMWKRLGEVSNCNPLVVVWKGEDDMNFFEKTEKTIDYIASANEDKKMETKYAIVMGIVCYIFKIYKEIVVKNLQNDISGHILFRTMLETFINLKYIMLQENDIPDVYDRFKAYGIGKYKLVMAKIREEKYLISDESQLQQKFMELLVNEDMDEAFVNTSFGYFDRTNISKKFIACDEKLLYEIYYEYGTNFTHGFWGAIRESAMLICDNPTHNYHTVPDYYAEQNIRSVENDCEMLMQKVFQQISEYIELPDFYYNK